MRLPSKKQWVQFFKVLTRKEKISFFVFLGLFLASALSLLIVFYAKNTEVSPTAGGTYIEGMVGSPRFINPLYAQNSDVDRSLVEIIFSGLMKYDGQGEIIQDLAKSVEIKESGKVYEVYLKEGLLWHDGKALAADDVIFTLKTIQNSDYKSPLRGNYLGIEIEKIDEAGVRFKLKEAYSGFLERLTFKILPKHIWENISPQNFLLTNYNLRPVGSGPYRLKEIKQDASNKITAVNLARFGQSNIAEISFKFFDTEKEMINAAKAGKIDGLSIGNAEYYNLLSKSDFNEYSLFLPRYFAVFFNPDKSRFLSDIKIRKALNAGIDKKNIVENVLLNRAEVIDSPILPQVFGFNLPSKIYEFNQEVAEGLLKDSGLVKNDAGNWAKTETSQTLEFKSDLKEGSQGKEVTNLQTCLARDKEVYPEGKISGYFGSQTKTAVIKFQGKYGVEGTGIVGKNTRAKLNEICSTPAKETLLKFSLATVDDPVLQKVAENLKEQWGKLGIGIDIQVYPVSQIEQEIIKPRNYEMLLFGEVLEIIPDPYPFWHSSQVKDPGLNLAKYENKSADKLLESARVSLDEETRAKKYQEFQDILIGDAPALFLYSPEYIYYVSKNIKGVDTKIIAEPSKRFANIEGWFIKTKRAWK
ncbi:MAG: peptide ABC transporter substrate-binding protein [Candidatus Nealsonbacteria bacterium]|nr:peptide ABC transporter substrate-binding protein [Candidatus Nealsonbacteria bacterium]